MNDFDRFDALPPVPITLGGVLDPIHVVGRELDEAEILDALSSGQSVNLPGERRHGKTMLSRRIEAQGRSEELRWTVVTRSVEGTRSVDEVTEELARDLVEVLPRLDRVRAWLRERTSLDVHGVQMVAETLTLEEVMAEACRHTDRLLLILDELPICARALERDAPGSGVAFMHRLRRLRQNHPELTMLCLGSIGFHHVVPDLEGVVNDMYKHSLGPLTPQGSLELAVRLLKSTPIGVDARRVLAPQLAVASEGVPYYLHHLAHGCRRRHATGGSLDAGSVAAHVTGAIADPDDPWDLKHYVTRLGTYYGAEAPAAGAILDLVADRPRSVSELRRGLPALSADLASVDVGSLMGRLEQDHYVMPVERPLRFRSEIVRRAWLRWRM